jgi:hypothetical protein
LVRDYYSLVYRGELGKLKGLGGGVKVKIGGSGGLFRLILRFWMENRFEMSGLRVERGLT